MISLFHDDCLNILPTLKSNSQDVILIDPPYNTTNKVNKAPKYDRNKDFERKKWKSFHSEWDSIDKYYAWSLQWLRESKRILTETGTIFICGTFHNIPDIAFALRKLGFYTIQWIQWCIPNSFPNLAMTKPINANQTIIWARKGDRHYYNKEAAKLYNDGKNLRDYWIIPKVSNEDSKFKHPSKKPYALIRRALDISLPKRDGVNVLDFFAGSGIVGYTTQRMSADCGVEINCTMVEKSAEYIPVIKERCTLT
jgi:site-specific DNA-methyltransferase (adenine-specific)